MKKLLIFNLMIMVLCYISCTEKTLDFDDSTLLVDNGNDSETEESIDYIVNYFLDNEPTIESELPFDEEGDNWVLYLGKVDENENEVIEVRMFNEKEDYLEYGDLNGIPIRKGVEIGDLLSAYAIENNIEAYYEENGEVPSWYSEYEDNTYTNYFQKPEKSQSRNLWIQLWKDCSSEGIFNTIPMLNTYPFMPPTWNNRTSQNEVVGIYAGTSVYDRTFYRRHLGTVWLWGLQKFCWNGFRINDKMSSGIKIL